ncbi:reverse transcriptase [Gossypium australe]|uniref:Reverse transcriptase n=1 Tax=Gossypium australe TaxID=47621 RepID=A0A5B6W9B5_9ROSI|nr:reverse transcriptase [Gossypium australe]
MPTESNENLKLERLRTGESTDSSLLCGDKSYSHGKGERLDRGLANDDWVSQFPKYQIHHLPHSFSDHYLLLITTRREVKRQVERKFKFEAWWVMEESFLGKVKSIWENSTRGLTT